MEPATTATSSYYGGFSRLAALAHQLRLYKPPPSPSLDDGAEEMEVGQDSAGKVVSQVGFEESIAPITKDHERFRPKRAAVLICIFEGDEGDLRVILTKRSSRLSTLTLEKFHCLVVKRRMMMKTMVRLRLERQRKRLVFAICL